MNKYAKKWVKALESGKYHQTTGILTVKKNKALAHCCLGLACHINRSILQRIPDGDSVAYNDRHGLLPTVIQDILKLSSSTGLFYVTAKVLRFLNKIRPNYGFQLGQQLDLSGLNDGHGLTFKEIAKIIKMKPTGLFKK